MLFSSIVFLYYFLPILMIVYFLSPKRFKNMILLLASLFFYFYGEPKYVILMVLSSFSGYCHGLWIDKAKGSRFSKLPLISSIVITIGLLMFFKYTDFFIKNVNWIFKLDLSPLNLVLPIGISFYSFQILSYTIDVYRGDAKVQRNFFDFTTYVTLFPQLIAGPIVRYTTVEEEMSHRNHSIGDMAYGINRFIIGLSKKIILANSLGELGNIFTKINEKTILFYWIAALSFMLQIYFDFSGYSDMAIGLGRMFGFHFLENFDYPFLSKSITEFWRRWHISLGTWFRDYVYIPMGGNRVSKGKWIRNVLVVWFLTGFWHGAEWNFIYWGLYFAILLVMEKYFIKGILERLPVVISHIYTIFFLLISFVLFNGDGLKGTMENLKGMFGFLNIPFNNHVTMYYLKSYGILIIIAMIGSTSLVKGFIEKIVGNKKGERLISILEPIFHIIMLLLNTAYLVDGSFNPFLYFRF